MRYSMTAAAGFVLLASAIPAGAQSSVNWTGPYVGLNLGGEWSRLSSSVAIPAAGGAVSQGRHDTDITGGGQVGYNWQLNNWVLGVEGDIRGGGPSSAAAVGAAGGGFVAGDSFKTESSWNASARGRIGYAFDRALVYATGGVAFADARMKANFVPTVAGAVALPGSSGSDSTTLVGPTVGAGLEYAVTPNISVGAEYRYTDYGHDRVNLGSVATAAGPVAVAGDVSLREHALLAKVNYRFGAPPPPPPAPAAIPVAAPPPPPKVFIVFFDWDKATITAEGMSIVQQAAAAYRSGGQVQIQVTGYTDRSGSPGYNQRLSERRANAVADALSQQGVPRTQMAVSGRGENENRVPTADGVREPQNRRVEITAP